MAVISTLKFAAVSLVLVGVANGQTLSPEQDINFPASGSASEPLKWLGANSPWFAGMLPF
jgi:acid phosphatase